jgi:hypothetical protein
MGGRERVADFGAVEAAENGVAEVTGADDGETRRKDGSAWGPGEQGPAQLGRLSLISCPLDTTSASHGRPLAHPRDVSHPQGSCKYACDGFVRTICRPTGSLRLQLGGFDTIALVPATQDLLQAHEEHQ